MNKTPGESCASCSSFEPRASSASADSSAHGHAHPSASVRPLTSSGTPATHGPTISVNGYGSLEAAQGVALRPSWHPQLPFPLPSGPSIAELGMREPMLIDCLLGPACAGEVWSLGGAVPAPAAPSSQQGRREPWTHSPSTGVAWLQRLVTQRAAALGASASPSRTPKTAGSARGASGGRADSCLSARASAGRAPAFARAATAGANGQRQRAIGPPLRVNLHADVLTFPIRRPAESREGLDGQAVAKSQHEQQPAADTVTDITTKTAAAAAAAAERNVAQISSGSLALGVQLRGNSARDHTSLTASFRGVRLMPWLRSLATGDPDPASEAVRLAAQAEAQGPHNSSSRPHADTPGKDAPSASPLDPGTAVVRSQTATSSAGLPSVNGVLSGDNLRSLLQLCGPLPASPGELDEEWEQATVSSCSGGDREDDEEELVRMMAITGGSLQGQQSAAEGEGTAHAHQLERDLGLGLGLDGLEGKAELEMDPQILALLSEPQMEVRSLLRKLHGGGAGGSSSSRNGGGGGASDGGSSSSLTRVSSCGSRASGDGRTSPGRGSSFTEAGARGASEKQKSRLGFQGPSPRGSPNPSATNTPRSDTSAVQVTRASIPLWEFSPSMLPPSPRVPRDGLSLTVVQSPRPAEAGLLALHAIRPAQETLAGGHALPRGHHLQTTRYSMPMSPPLPLKRPSTAGPVLDSSPMQGSSRASGHFGSRPPRPGPLSKRAGTSMVRPPSPPRPSQHQLCQEHQHQQHLLHQQQHLQQQQQQRQQQQRQHQQQQLQGLSLATSPGQRKRSPSSPLMVQEPQRQPGTWHQAIDAAVPRAVHVDDSGRKPHPKSALTYPSPGVGRRSPVQKEPGWQPCRDGELDEKGPSLAQMSPVLRAVMYRNSDEQPVMEPDAGPGDDASEGGAGSRSDSDAAGSDAGSADGEGNSMFMRQVMLTQRMISCPSRVRGCDERFMQQMNSRSFRSDANDAAVAAVMSSAAPAAAADAPMQLAARSPSPTTGGLLARRRSAYSLWLDEVDGDSAPAGRQAHRTVSENRAGGRSPMRWSPTHRPPPRPAITATGTHFDDILDDDDGPGDGAGSGDDDARLAEAGAHLLSEKQQRLLALVAVAVPPEAIEGHDSAYQVELDAPYSYAAHLHGQPSPASPSSPSATRAGNSSPLTSTRMHHAGAGAAGGNSNGFSRAQSTPFRSTSIKTTQPQAAPVRSGRTKSGVTRATTAARVALAASDRRASLQADGLLASDSSFGPWLELHGGEGEIRMSSPLRGRTLPLALVEGMRIASG